MSIVGKRTSVYLSDDLAAAVAESGVPLAELIRRGLGTEDRVRDKNVVGPEAMRRPRDAGQARRRCPHPGTRMIGGWCRQCGVVVEPGGYLPNT